MAHFAENALLQDSHTEIYVCMGKCNGILKCTGMYWKCTRISQLYWKSTGILILQCKTEFSQDRNWWKNSLWCCIVCERLCTKLDTWPYNKWISPECRTILVNYRPDYTISELKKTFIVIIVF